MPSATTPHPPERRLPRLHTLNEAFWTGGAEGELRITRCDACGTWIHPPNPMCRACLNRAVSPRAVSGRGVVFSFTVNHQVWAKDVPVPYVIALVELEEDESLRLTTNIVGCSPAEVHVGMPVRVVFEQHGDCYVPLFEPNPSAPAAPVGS